jgi:hypothetical protein
MDALDLALVAERPRQHFGCSTDNATYLFVSCRDESKGDLSCRHSGHAVPCIEPLVNDIGPGERDFSCADAAARRHIIVDDLRSWGGSLY